MEQRKTAPSVSHSGRVRAAPPARGTSGDHVARHERRDRAEVLDDVDDVEAQLGCRALLLDHPVDLAADLEPAAVAEFVDADKHGPSGLSPSNILPARNCVVRR